MGELQAHPSRYRAIPSLTFEFGAPCFVKKIAFDQKALRAARLKAIPEQCAWLGSEYLRVNIAIVLTA